MFRSIAVVRGPCRPPLIGSHEQVFNLFAQLVHVSQVVSYADLSAAMAWIRTAGELQHSSLLLAYETSLRLSNMWPPCHHCLGILASSGMSGRYSVDEFSACVRNHSLTYAVELLEQGRGFLLSQLTRLRSPLDDGIASGPAGLPLSSLLCDILESPSEDQHEQAFHLNFELQAAIDKIRELPSLSRFLLPSLFSDLRRVASRGPVIIVNASKYGCDALIVFRDRETGSHPVADHTRQRSRTVSGAPYHTSLLLEGKPRKTSDFARELWDPPSSIFS